MLSEEIMYRALVEKDVSFDGIFVAAVKTTGIFCRSTCTARKPKKENVEFFNTSKEAILHGYRPCKICSPLEKSGSTPAFIKHLLEEMKVDDFSRMKDGDLRSKGLEPNKIRKWFKKNHGITFHSYQRMLRINTAFKKIQKGESVSAFAFDAGYESLSGFTGSYKTVLGLSPTKSITKNFIYLSRLETPIGPMFAGGSEKGICLLEFTDRRMLETEFKSLEKAMNGSFIQGESQHMSLLRIQLEEYFDGRRKNFTVPLFAPGTVFQQLVWDELQKIPYGTTRSYKQQARAIDKPEAVRAVANANGMNRMAILIPCHRVIGEDGTMTGYGGGIWRKKWLLDLETGQKTITQ